MYESCIKRLLDLILSLAACVVLAIPMGIIALWIKKDSPGPVFFKQRRVGRGKKCWMLNRQFFNLNVMFLSSAMIFLPTT